MKTKAIITLLLLCLVFVSCDKDDSNDDYQMVSVATPEFMSLDAFRNSVEITTPTEIIESGKIYVYNNLVLVNDVNSGIHIIDNSNPQNPKKVAFIKIKSNKDMEIKGDFLYADSLMDLVVFDISNIENIKEVERLENVFPSYPIWPVGVDVFEDGDPVTDGFIVGWTITEELRKKEDVVNTGGGVFFDGALVNTASAESSTGQGGSLARFKIVDDYLYAVDSHNINIFNINNLEEPQVLDPIYAGFDIETIFNRGEHLFLGSMRGMYIYDITNPGIPEFVSQFEHGTACDPVVVDDNYAYITLRAGNFCGAFDSSLQIVDITDLENPELTKSYAMDGPYGLGIKDNFLFICDGASGLKVYNKSDVNNLVLLDHFEDINTYDVIPLSDRLLMIGDGTLFQYEYTGNTGITLLSEFNLN